MVSEAKILPDGGVVIRFEMLTYYVYARTHDVRIESRLALRQNLGL
jgi:hypothetical protein